MQAHEKWLTKAEEDLSFASLGLREQFFSHACFLCQQVVEKSLKGFLLGSGRPYPRQHKVVDLVSLCPEIQADLEPLKDELKLLDEFYVPTRYPDAIPGSLPAGSPSLDDAQTAFQTASAVLDLVRTKLTPPPPQPTKG